MTELFILIGVVLLLVVLGAALALDEPDGNQPRSNGVLVRPPEEDL